MKNDDEISFVNIDGLLLQPLPIILIINNFQLWNFPYAIRFKDGKTIRIERLESDLRDTFKNYQHKGVSAIWAEQTHINEFLARIKLRLKELGNEQKDKQEKNLLNLDDAFQVMRNIMLRGGLEEGALDSALNINRQVLKEFNLNDKFVKMLRQMRSRCSEQFLKNIYTSLLVQSMASNYSWYNAKMLERMVMAIMLCDLTLNNRDYAMIQSGNWEELSQEARAHPLKVAQLIAKFPKYAHKETLTIIEQHHEWPSGEGFPHGLKGNQINFLSAFVIVAGAFVDLEFACNFDHEQKYKNLQDLYEVFYENCTSKHFREAMNGLFKALGLNAPNAEAKKQI